MIPFNYENPICVCDYYRFMSSNELLLLLIISVLYVLCCCVGPVSLTRHLFFPTNQATTTPVAITNAIPINMQEEIGNGMG